jgi:WD40 repeat protein
VESRKAPARGGDHAASGHADLLQDTNYGVFLLVILEALRDAPTLDGAAGLIRRFVSHPHLSALLPATKSVVVAFSRDGKLLASASADNTVILWGPQGAQS